MINELGDVLASLFKQEMTAITLDEQIGFRAPDDDWRQEVVAGNRNCINIFLYRLSEDRERRQNDWDVDTSDQAFVESPPPFPLRCHYMITAWSPANPSPATTPTRDEHLLLYQALMAALCHNPLKPSDVYGGLMSQALANAELHVEVLPEVDASRTEFWSTLNQPWRPCLDLQITLPLPLVCLEIEGGLVRTITTKYLPGAEELIHIGGTVRDNAGEVVAGAWLRLDEAARATTSDENGKFQFDTLETGAYTLRIRAQGSELVTPLEVPSASGSYDVKLP